jgi:methylmalonyl-CoA mutase N-terminal domain/subunit
VQEVAFTLADGIAYVEAAIKSGMDVDAFAGRLSFFFNAQNDLFEEAAKYRAARRLWARIMKERFGAKEERSMKLRFHTQTAGAALTAQQPRNNIARVTLQALAAVLGGTQSLHTNSFDEALALPSEDSARIALRTQQIIAYESGAADTADPLAGSYYVESLTDEIEKAAGAYIEKIDALGGATAAIEQGYIQREIADSAYAFQKAVESGDKVVVGLNKFQTEEEPMSGLLRVDPAVADRQAEKLRKLRAGRDGDAAGAALLTLREAAKTDANLMPLILDCARLYCTEGEIAGTLRQVFGEYRPAEIL